MDKDGAESFPGALTVNVTYEVTEESELVIDYQATTSKPTPVDLSHHVMLNLSGHVSLTLQAHAFSVIPPYFNTIYYNEA